jgi:hypothetical protein
VIARREPIEYADASPEVRAVYDDIMATRNTDWVNDFWKVLAHDPPTLRRIWANIKDVMGPGALDPLTKELLYLLHRLARRYRAQQGHDRGPVLGVARDRRPRE